MEEKKKKKKGKAPNWDCARTHATPSSKFQSGDSHPSLSCMWLHWLFIFLIIKVVEAQQEIQESDNGRKCFEPYPCNPPNLGYLVECSPSCLFKWHLSVFSDLLEWTSGLVSSIAMVLNKSIFLRGRWALKQSTVQGKALSLGQKRVFPGVTIRAWKIMACSWFLP